MQCIEVLPVFDAQYKRSSYPGRSLNLKSEICTPGSAMNSDLRML